MPDDFLDATEGCKLLDGWVAGSFQLFLGVLALSSLLVQRHFEEAQNQFDAPRRSRIVWIMDCGKQVASLLVAHSLAIIMAMLTSVRTHHEGSECGWYLVMFTVDTVLGTALTLVFHRIILRLVENEAEKDCFLDRIAKSLRSCGSYGDPPSIRRWMWQTGEWLLCVLAARLCCTLTLIWISPQIVGIPRTVDRLFGSHVAFELFTVMGMAPLLLNAAQALIQDACLRYRNGRSALSSQDTIIYSAL